MRTRIYHVSADYELVDSGEGAWSVGGGVVFSPTSYKAMGVTKEGVYRSLDLRSSYAITIGNDLVSRLSATVSPYARLIVASTARASVNEGDYIHASRSEFGGGYGVSVSGSLEQGLGWAPLWSEKTFLGGSLGLRTHFFRWKKDDLRTNDSDRLRTREGTAHTSSQVFVSSVRGYFGLAY